MSRDEWLVARKELLVKEKEFTRRRDALNAERRGLPMVKIDKDYVFEGPNGRASLLDLFDGRRQLIVTHFTLTALGRQEDWEESKGAGNRHTRRGPRLLVMNAMTARLQPTWARTMRLPQVSSNTAWVTGPIFVGALVKTTPSPIIRSYSA